jgi:hypothetical protein
MAWGSQGQVFLGEDLMHTRDYSEHTSQVIDDEVEIILRAQEERALEVLARHRGGLDAVARALLDEETIDGETVGRLVDTAYGRPVHKDGVRTVPPIFVASQHGPTGTGDADGPPAGDKPAAAPDRPVAVGSATDDGTEGSDAPAEAGVGGLSHASDAGPESASEAAPPAADGTVGQAPWPPPPAPGHWPKKAPWPPPPPPPTSR